LRVDFSGIHFGCRQSQHHKFFVIKSVSFLSIFFYLMLNALFAQQMSLSINFGISNGTHTESKLAIARNGSPWKLVRPAKPVNSEVLEFGNNYLLTFEKSGYISKQISINTGNIPKEVQASGLTLTVSAEIKPENSGVNEPNLVKYKYDAAAKGFIQEKVAPVSAPSPDESRKRAEATFDLITKEEEKEQQYSKHFVKEDALEGRKGEGSTKKEVVLTEEQKQKEEARKAAAIKAADEARIAQLAKIEEQRKTLQLKEIEDSRAKGIQREEELREQAAAQKVVEVERKEKDAKAAVLAREAEAARAEEERRRKDAEAKVELEKRKKEAQQKFQQEQRTSTPAASKVAEEKPMTIAEAGNIVSRFEEIIQEEKRVIKQITVKRERHTFVYRKVKYDWGGVYYFKNDMDITKLDFDNESAAVK
jgi:hypothetical protein